MQANINKELRICKKNKQNEFKHEVQNLSKNM